MATKQKVWKRFFHVVFLGDYLIVGLNFLQTELFLRHLERVCCTFWLVIKSRKCSGKVHSLSLLNALGQVGFLALRCNIRIVQETKEENVLLQTKKNQ